MIQEYWTDFERGCDYLFEVFFASSYKELDISKISQSRAVCFLNGDVDKICIVKNGRKNIWGLPGGNIDAGETPEDALERELKEEANLEINNFKLLAYQNAKNLTKNIDTIQLRFVCNVNQKEKFISDPAGTIVEVKFVNKNEIQNLINENLWSDSKMYLIEKATEEIKFL